MYAYKYTPIAKTSTSTYLFYIYVHVCNIGQLEEPLYYDIHIIEYAAVLSNCLKNNGLYEPVQYIVQVYTSKQVYPFLS